MVELIGSQARLALPLFLKSPRHMIARSCCMGLTPCRVFADDVASPTAAVLVLKRFGIGFAAGDAAHAGALLAGLNGWHTWYEINDPPADWHPALAAWSRQSQATVRYGFRDDPAQFDKNRLRALATPPPGCTLARYDRALLDEALLEKWSEDQIGAFEAPQDFLRDGIGIALIREGRLVSGCASFCRHPDGFEIQVDTHPEARGKGYAACVCAAFMLEVLAQGRVPYWDAANPVSLRLAQKLGFAFDAAYTAWLLISDETAPETVIQTAVGS